MKKLPLVLSSFLAFTLLAGCNNENASSGSTGGTSTGTSTPIEEEYVIKVTAPTGITYTLSKEKAKAGESVTLTITSVPESYSIKTVTVNGAAVSGTGNVYTFVMPNRSVTISITCDVIGDVTISGDFAAVLEEQDDGTYVARDVEVQGTGTALFSYYIASGSEKIKLNVMSVDRLKCFADLESTYNKSEALEIAAGATYDFYYNPSSATPCYVVRKSVNKLPNSVSSLRTLFDGMIRSESSVNYPGLNGISYKTTNTEDSENILMIDYDMKIYDNNTSYAKVKNTLESKTYHVYKEVKDNQLLIVDTYTVAKGNDDRFRYTYNDYGAYSGRFDIVADNVEANRVQVNESEAYAQLNHGSHYGYYLEREFMDAYRVGFEASEVSASNISISSDDNGDGTFTTKIDSFVEYDSSASSTTSELHEAYIFDATLTFLNNGALSTLEYSKTKFKKTEWNFSSHAPLAGQEGTVVKSIAVAYSYGALHAGSGNTFDVTPYFLTSVDKIKFYDPKTTKPESDNNSYLHYSDAVSLNKIYETNYPYLKTFQYTPSTALDIWEYGPVASSNNSVITKENNDLWNEMTCVGIGDATVTFSNHTASSGITFDVKINVTAIQKFHALSIYSTWGGHAGDVTSATSANIVAGTVQSFKISATPESAPVIYDAVSENPTLLKVVETGQKLTLDATGAASITTAQTVRIKLTSDWYQDSVTNKYTFFTFTIIPASANPIGTAWESSDANLAAHVKLNFTSTPYGGSTTTYTGTITDDGYDPDSGTNKYEALNVTFEYAFSNGTVKASVRSISISPNKNGFSSDPADYVLDFYYEANTDRFGVYLAEKYYDSEGEGFIYSPIFGECDDQGYATSYSPFSRVS